MTWRIQNPATDQVSDERMTIPAAGVPTLPHEPARYIAGVFRDLVERTPSVAEIDAWTEQFNSGSKRATFLSFIVHSDEFRTLWVRRTYLDVFRREATIEEVRHWLNFFARGRSHDEALATLLSSPEYTARFGNRYTDYVRTLYTVLFGRKAGTGEAESWAGLLDAKCATFAGVAMELVKSPEHGTRQLNEWFWRYFGRAIDPESMDLYGDYFRKGESWEAVLIRVLDCREYYRRKLR